MAVRARTAAPFTASRPGLRRCTIAGSGKSCSMAKGGRSGPTWAISAPRAKPPSIWRARSEAALRKAPRGGQLDPIDEEINRFIARVGTQVHPRLSRHQAPIWRRVDALTRAGQEPGASVRSGQFVPCATTAAGMRTRQPETAISTAQAAKKVQQLPK